MSIQIFRKVLKNHCHLDCADLTSDEKERLYSLLAKYGLPKSTAYTRLFAKGFDEWELLGIDKLKKEFARENNLGHLEDVRHGFYTALTAYPGMKARLVNKLSTIGLEHRNTIENRFNTDDWAPWERIGIKNIIEDFCSSISSEAPPS